MITDPSARRSASPSGGSTLFPASNQSEKESIPTKTLETIQKTYNVFKTLVKIAMILSFIWAGTLLLGVPDGSVWQ